MKKTLGLLLAAAMLFSLCACGGDAASPGSNPAGTPAPKETEAVPELAYSVSVEDTEGRPIPGVKLQFCDSITCTLGDTGEYGEAVFMSKEESCTVHVLQTPPCCKSTEEEFRFPDGGRELRIALETLKPATDVPEAGFSYYLPEKYEEMKGVLRWEISREDDFIYRVSPVYYGVAKENFSSYGFTRFRQDYKFENLFDVFCVMKDEAEAEAYLKAERQSMAETQKNIKETHDAYLAKHPEIVDRPYHIWNTAFLEKIGTVENMTCFLAQDVFSEEELAPYSADMGELFEEFTALRDDKETFLSGIMLKKPVPVTLLFDTEDLDGNAVSLSEVFAGSKVTMVNIWDIGCAPCRELLPYLQELSKRFEEKNCQIIGVCTDYKPGDDASEARSILAAAGVTYLNVVGPEIGHPLIEELTGSPYFFYVDSEGRLLTVTDGAYYGDARQIYTDKLDTALSYLEG